MEVRQLMSGTSLEITQVDQVLQIQGGYGGDQIIVREENGQVTVDGIEQRWTLITQIVVLAGDGNDRVELHTGISSYIDGGEGNDQIHGGEGHDTIHGNEGNDRIYGEGGNDRLMGGGGIDEIRGGSGDDVLWSRNAWDSDHHFIQDGLSGSDSLHGQSGDDLIDGSREIDGFSWNDGQLMVIGTDTDDLITLRQNNGFLYVDSIRRAWMMPGSVTVSGLGGNDTIYNDTNLVMQAFGGEGDDEITGGSKSDALHGDGGNDFIRGRGGNDEIRGGSGDDELWSRLDWDSDHHFIQDGISGSDSLHGQSGDDLIDGSREIDGFSWNDGRLTVVGTDADDRIILRQNNGVLYVDSVRHAWNLPVSLAIETGSGVDYVDNQTDIGIMSYVSNGRHFELQTPTGSEFGTLVGHGEGSFEPFNKVKKFNVKGATFHVTRSDNSVEIISLNGPLPNEMLNHSVEVPGVSPGRGIVGDTWSAADINRAFVNSDGKAAAATLLGAVRRIKNDATRSPTRPNGTLGTGVLLNRGGNQYVLTAHHVVAGARASQLWFDGRAVADIVATSEQFGGRDLALLRLVAPVNDVVGAVLPDFSVLGRGTSVLVAGYGNIETGRSGDLKFGFSEVDRIVQGPLEPFNEVTGTTSSWNGPFAEYVYETNKDEVATAPGDSGGPDIVPFLRVDSAGNRLWLPIVAAIHNSGESTVDLNRNGEGDIPGNGDRWHSTAIDAFVANVIRSRISDADTPNLVLEKIWIYNDSEPDHKGPGEWVLSVDIRTAQGSNITYKLGEYSFSDSGTGAPVEYKLGIPLNVGDLTDRFQFTFRGYEEDGPFDADDRIQSWSTVVQFPSRKLTGTRTFISSGIQDSGDASYQLQISVGDPRVYPRTENGPTIAGLISGPDQETVTITPVNDSPLFAINASNPGFTEGDGSLVVAGTATISDLDDTHLTQAVIQITGNYVHGEDLLAVQGVLPDGITASEFDPVTGTLTLTGLAKLIDYQQALRQITYRNTNTGKPDTGDREITFTITDDNASQTIAGGFSATAEQTVTVTVTPLNDSPTITARTTSLNFTEGDEATVLADLFLISDVDDTHLTQAAIQITGNYAHGEDLLAVNDVLPNGITASEFDTLIGTLTLTGRATLADYQQALQRISYQNPNTRNPETGDREITLTVADDNARQTGAGALMSSARRTITITPINDSLLLDLDQAGQHLKFEIGDPPRAVLAGLLLSDVDDTQLTQAVIQITGHYVNGEDVLALDRNLMPAGITAAFDASMGTLTLQGLASVAKYQALLAAVTYQNTNAFDPEDGTRTITVTVTDNNTHRQGAGVSTATDTRDIEIKLNRFIVDTLVDVVAHDGFTSLREAILAANTNARVADVHRGMTDGDFIVFADHLTGGTIVLNTRLPGLGITDDLIISDSNAIPVTIQGTRNRRSVRILNVQTTEQVTISDLTLTGGRADKGGAILVGANARLDLNRISITGNKATQHGGAIYNDRGILNVTNSAISGNTATQHGGALYANGGTTTLSNSTISRNSAGPTGNGGGVLNQRGNLIIAHSTITGNKAGNTAGGLSTTGVTTLTHTIVAGNKARNNKANDIIGVLTAGSDYNLIGNATTSGRLLDGVNGNIVGNGGTGTLTIGLILDATLADNGGPTLTHALVSGSLAVNVGNGSLASPPATDQRGLSRVVNGRIDIGAVETE